MKKEHPHAQVLRWIADGEEVQVKSQFGIWSPISEKGLGWLGELLAASSTRPDYEQFRLKPKTIPIGDREIEAPVMSGPGYYITQDGHAYRWFEDSACNPRFDLQKRGLVYATEEAARAAQEAITALLTREPS